MRVRLAAGLLTAALLTACAQQPAALTPARSSAMPTPSPSATKTTAKATPKATPTKSRNKASVTASGDYTISLSGAGGHCDYSFPALKSGLKYSVTAKELGGKGWSLTVQGPSPDHITVALNTERATYANGAQLNGTVHARADLKHADFDLELEKISNHVFKVRLKGSIDCA